MFQDSQSIKGTGVGGRFGLPTGAGFLDLTEPKNDKPD